MGATESGNRPLEAEIRRAEKRDSERMRIQSKPASAANDANANESTLRLERRVDCWERAFRLANGQFVLRAARRPKQTSERLCQASGLSGQLVAS